MRERGGRDNEIGIRKQRRREGQKGQGGEESGEAIRRRCSKEKEGDWRNELLRGDM